MWESVEHAILVVGGLAAALGLGKTLWSIRNAAVQAALETQNQTDLLNRINKELHPNGGASLADRVGRIESGLNEHRFQADKYFSDNASEHEALHRRIDGLFEIVAKRELTEARRLSERHRVVREADPNASE